jgi:hypothetical protein
MKVYFYMVISVGLMLTFALAGIEGVGTNVSSLFIDQNDTIINPTTQTDTDVSITNYQTLLKASSYNLWQKVLIALLAMAVLAALSGFQVLGFSAGGDKTKAIMALFSYFIFGFIASDMWSIVTLVFGFGVAWVSWLLAVLMAGYIIGFAVAVIEFTRGGD